ETAPGVRDTQPFDYQEFLDFMKRGKEHLTSYRLVINNACTVCEDTTTWTTARTITKIDT
ncbi:MAG: hypothetical protein ACYS91_14135, partial [Planctomycetota bacterium]